MDHVYIVLWEAEHNNNNNNNNNNLVIYLAHYKNNLMSLTVCKK